jgi:hypothetical protein
LGILRLVYESNKAVAEKATVIVHLVLKTKPMKNFLPFVFLSFCVIAGCKKDSPGHPRTYSSIEHFYAVNGVPIQNYIINGVSGGSFTTPAGTVVTIPPNAFMNASYQPITGNVTVEFKDIYKKSDMLLSQMPTQFSWGAPMKSAGEFFIRVSVGTTAVALVPGKKIDVKQPLLNTGGIMDSLMEPLVFRDTLSAGWTLSPGDSLFFGTSDYIFSLYSFSDPLEEGTWCNSDNAYYFNAYPQTLLTIVPLDDPAAYDQDVFLIFQDVNSMIHVYGNGTSYPYHYAPVGLECTVVAFGVKDGKLYSSFTPITISANQTVSFTLSETTSEEFKTQLEALD